MALRWTRLSCRAFRDNAVRLQLFALAYNLANFLRSLALPQRGGAVVADHACARSWSRSAPGSCATAATSSSSWPRWRCRGRCSPRSCAGSTACEDRPWRRPDRSGPWSGQSRGENHAPKVGRARRKPPGRPAARSRIAHADRGRSLWRAFRLTHNPSRSTVEPENGGYLGDVGLVNRRGSLALSCNNDGVSRETCCNPTSGRMRTNTMSSPQARVGSGDPPSGEAGTHADLDLLLALPESGDAQFRDLRREPATAPRRQRRGRCARRGPGALVAQAAAVARQLCHAIGQRSRQSEVRHGHPGAASRDFRGRPAMGLRRRRC